MNRDLPVCGQVTQNGHSDEDREEETPEVGLGGEGQPGVGGRTSGGQASPPTLGGGSQMGVVAPSPSSGCGGQPALLALCSRAGVEMALVPHLF